MQGRALKKRRVFSSQEGEEIGRTGGMKRKENNTSQEIIWGAKESAKSWGPPSTDIEKERLIGPRGKIIILIIGGVIRWAKTRFSVDVPMVRRFRSLAWYFSVELKTPKIQRSENFLFLVITSTHSTTSKKSGGPGL